MRQIARMLVLVFVLAGPAYAGDMGNGVTSPPPPPTSTALATADSSADGDMEKPEAVSKTGLVLSLLESLLALF